jgi:hypothetical protein
MFLHMQAGSQTFHDDFATFREASRTQRPRGPDPSRLIEGPAQGTEQ